MPAWHTCPRAAPGSFRGQAGGAGPLRRRGLRSTTTRRWSHCDASASWSAWTSSSSIQTCAEHAPRAGRGLAHCPKRRSRGHPTAQKQHHCLPRPHCCSRRRTKEHSFIHTPTRHAGRRAGRRSWGGIGRCKRTRERAGAARFVGVESEGAAGPQISRNRPASEAVWGRPQKRVVFVEALYQENPLLRGETLKCWSRIVDVRVEPEDASGRLQPLSDGLKIGSVLGRNRLCADTVRRKEHVQLVV